MGEGWNYFAEGDCPPDAYSVHHHVGAVENKLEDMVKGLRDKFCFLPKPKEERVSYGIGIIFEGDLPNTDIEYELSISCAKSEYSGKYIPHTANIFIERRGSNKDIDPREEVFSGFIEKKFKEYESELAIKLKIN